MRLQLTAKTEANKSVDAASTNATDEPTTDWATSTLSASITTATSMGNTPEAARLNKPSTERVETASGSYGKSTPAAAIIDAASNNSMDESTRDGEGTDQSTEKRKTAGSPGRGADGITIFDKSQQRTKKASRLQPPAGMSSHETPLDKVRSTRPLRDWLEGFGTSSWLGPSWLGLDATPSPSKKWNCNWIC